MKCCKQSINPANLTLQLLIIPDLNQNETREAFILVKKYTEINILAG